MPYTKNPKRLHYIYKAEYKAWCKMKSRCCNDKDPDFHNYGSRGISVCKKWLNNPEAFIRDMGKRPKGYTLERLDVNGDYDPSNCVWADRKAQSVNRRRTRFFTINGQKKCIADWARHYGLKPTLVTQRINRDGWPILKALGLDNETEESVNE